MLSSLFADQCQGLSDHRCQWLVAHRSHVVGTPPLLDSSLCPSPLANQGTHVSVLHVNKVISSELLKLQSAIHVYAHWILWSSIIIEIRKKVLILSFYFILERLQCIVCARVQSDNYGLYM